jgi:enoyl-CoA hydratase/carnithine racemase
MRIASRELAFLSQPEVGCGLFPGGCAMERIPLCVNRSLAFEIIFGARRIAGWDGPAVAAAKQAVNARSRMTTPELTSKTEKKFFEFMSHAAPQARAARLMSIGLQVRGETEYDLPRYL